MTQKSAPAPVVSANRRPFLTLPFICLTALFVACLIISNLIEIKTVPLGPFTVTAGLAVFPISYIINDCIVEVYGFRPARLVIWLGFALSLITALLLQLALALPGTDDWQHQEAMEAIYGSVPRIMIASFTAFICGSMVNAYVMSIMKRRASRTAVGHKRLTFSLRAIISTLWGEGVDSIIFFPIAFAGALTWSTIASLIIAQALLKTLYEILVLPVTVIIVQRLKRLERLDTIDPSGTDYRWWRLTDL